MYQPGKVANPSRGQLIREKEYFPVGSYGNKILYKNLDLTQDFPNKISFHFLWVKMLPKNLPKIFRWP